MNRIWLALVLCFIFTASTQAQFAKVALSGLIKDGQNRTALSFANITLKTAKDSAFIAGTISGEDGRFVLSDIKSGNYLLHISSVGYQTKQQAVTIGQLSNVLELGSLELTRDAASLDAVTVTANNELVSSRMDKKTISVAGTSARPVARSLEL